MTSDSEFLYRMTCGMVNDSKMTFDELWLWVPSTIEPSPCNALVILIFTAPTNSGLFAHLPLSRQHEFDKGVNCRTLIWARTSEGILRLQDAEKERIDRSQVLVNNSAGFSSDLLSNCLRCHHNIVSLSRKGTTGAQNTSSTVYAPLFPQLVVTWLPKRKKIKSLWQR